MTTRRLAALPHMLLLTALAATAIVAQTNPQDPSYVPGVTFQTTNPNYPVRNPFYFEGRIDWNLLGIATPSNAWEYVQRGIHEQDDLLDTTDAISDYQQAISMNNLANGTCQLIT